MLRAGAISRLTYQIFLMQKLTFIKQKSIILIYCRRINLTILINNLHTTEHRSRAKS